MYSNADQVVQQYRPGCTATQISLYVQQSRPGCTATETALYNNGHCVVHQQKPGCTATHRPGCTTTYTGLYSNTWHVVRRNTFGLYKQLHVASCTYNYKIQFVRMPILSVYKPYTIQSTIIFCRNLSINMGSSFEDLDARSLKVKTVRKSDKRFLRYFVFKKRILK